MPQPGERTRKRHFPTHWIVVFLLLLIPVSVAVYGFLPSYSSFTAPGEIVPVREIGVQGSVDFVYVRAGVTRNRYEKFTVRNSIPDAEFAPADSDLEEAFDDNLALGEELRNETIEHALDQAADESDTAASLDERGERLNRLIDETSEYYGNSIGLMLGIGLVEEEQHEDFSRNGMLTIAGTGTLEADGSVGSVGGIRDKLRTAERDGADIFFVPKDKETFEYVGLSNEEEAEQTAQELFLHLQVVPVATLEEAVSYLRQLS